MGCGNQCPYIPAKRYLNGTYPTPPTDRSTRSAPRDDIAHRIERLVTELAQQPAQPDAPA